MSHPLYLVVGLGQTGLSIARHLARRQVPFLVYDTRNNPQGATEFKFNFPGIELYLGNFPEARLESLSGIICSPGVPLEEDFIQEALNKNIPVFGDIDCLVKELDAPIVAITGTNGKSTVTTLVGEMAKASGLKVAVAGNIGLPVLDMLDVGVDYDLWVLELSSFQLELTHALAPSVATILNISPDHLDRHLNFEAYVASKKRIYEQADHTVYNRDDKLTAPSPAKQTTSFGSDRPQDGQWGLIENEGVIYLAKGEERILAVSAIKLRGKHNWMNALAAAALANTQGIETQFIVEVLERFAGLPHRSQWVRTIEGVDWVNDSKATNVGATIASITGIGASMAGKVVLIAGGQGKGAEFNELKASLAEHVRAVILMGEDADELETVIPQSVQVVRVNQMDEAVRQAQRIAMKGDVVLLSPACASFDMFRDFNHRGDDFMASVKAL
tara:strand:- start:1981 stop:3312 length:1332 start_codon:yes stop_codon:yes gene_type:complete